MKVKKTSNHSKRSVLICLQCGEYLTNNLENIQICSCNTLLKFRGEKLDNTKEVVDCKICSLIATKN